MQACKHASMQACKHASMQACKHASMQASKHACMHVCMYVCMFGMFVCMHVCMHVRRYVYLCIYIYVYVYVHIHIVFACTYLHICMYAYVHMYLKYVYMNTCILGSHLGRKKIWTAGSAGKPASRCGACNSDPWLREPTSQQQTDACGALASGSLVAADGRNLHDPLAYKSATIPMALVYTGQAGFISSTVAPRPPARRDCLCEAGPTPTNMATGRKKLA